jgi:K+-sensing histidine kinase KdpD
MGWFVRHRSGLAALAGLLLPLGVAGMLVAFRASFADAAAALVLVAVIAVVGTVGTRFAGYLASISASLWFDFFLTRPYEQLTISRRPDIEITVSLLVVGVVITELAAASRRHHDDARAEASYVARIARISELVASGAPMDDIVESVRTELVDLLQLRACRFEKEDSSSTWAKELGRDGRVHLVGVDWPVGSWGLPGPELALAVQHRGRVVAHFVLSPTPGVPVSLRRRRVAVALADQVGPLVRHLHAA